MSVDNAITKSLVEEVMSKIAGLIIKGKKTPQLVRVIHEPRKFRKTKVDRTTTTSSTFPDQESPDIEIKNPLDRTTMIKSISLVPDSTFKTNGRVKIFVDEVLVLEDSAVADWTDLSEFVLDFEGGREIKQNRSVIALIKTSSGTSALTLVVTFGD